MKTVYLSLTLLFFLTIKSNATIINNIEVKNNNRISKETIITYGNVIIGKDYSQEDLNDIIKKLYQTNFFKNISLKLDDKTLIINIEENKIIQRVLVEGIKSETIKEKILENLFSKDKSPFLIEKVNKDRLLILSSLNYLGYYLANVETRFVDNSNDTVDLIFDIELGNKSKISSIEFIGDKKFKNRVLRNVIISEESKFWKFITNNKFINKDRINRDKRLLRNFYLNKGYFDVKIESANAKFTEDETFKLTFKINAGSIYTVNDIKLNLPIDYDETNFAAVKDEMNKMVNKPYSLNQISKIVNEIDKISLSRQYDFINADLQENVTSDNSLDITINIKESEKFYVERINIFGNNITYENVIRNKLEIDEGDPYNELLNAKSVNNLRASGLFSNVTSNLEEGSSKNSKIVNVEVTEKPTGEISVGAGAGSDGGTVAFSVSENNFLGKGIKLGASTRISEDVLTASFSFLNPNFRYQNKSLSTSIETTQTDKMTENGYESSKTGFSIGTGFEQYENVYFTPKISNYIEDLTTNSKASKNLKKQSGSYTESKFSYGLDYDMRNQKFQTSDGFRSYFKQSIPIYSDEFAFSNSYDFKIWNKLPNEMVTSLSFFGKHVNSLNGEDVRITNRFYIPRSKLRGFKVRQVGPVDGKDYIGGNYASTINFDTTLPMLFPSLENIDFKYFIDTANLWGVDYSSSIDDSNEIRASTGFLVDWFTPIGPLNFSISQDLNKVSTDKTESFQFNLGTTF